MSKISKKDLINQIKTDAEKIEVPDLTEQIKSKINYDNKEVIAYEKPHKNHFKFSFGILSYAILILALVIAIPFIITKSPGKVEKPNIVPHAKETFVVQATSLFNFASNLKDNNKMYYLSSFILLDNEDEVKPDEEENDPIVDYYKLSDELLKYMDTIEEFYNKDDNKYELVKLTEGDYQYKINVEIKLGQLNNVYTMYFNETKLNEEDDDDIDEVSSSIEGYIECGSERYNIKGKKEVEKDECEVEVTLYLNNDNSNYIVVKQEIENRENEYSYDFYENNNLIRELEIELEAKNSTNTIELSEEDHINNISKEFEFNYFDDMIKVNFEDNEIEYEVEIKMIENYYEFNFGNDIVIKKERKIKKNKNISNNPNKNEHLIVL